MSWQFRRNVPSDDILKAADSSIAARDASIRRPAEHVFVIPDEVYEHMRRRQTQRTNWDLINLQEVRRRDTSTLVILLQLLEEKFRSFTDDGELFERVALGLCKSIPKDFLMHCFLDSISLDNDPARQSFYQTNLESFGQNELSSWYKSSDLYNVLKAMNQKKSPSAIIADKLQRDLEEIEAALELLDLLPTIPRWPEEALKKKIRDDIRSLDSHALSEVCYPQVESTAFETADKKYLPELYKKLESPWSRPYSLDRNQYEPAEKILNTRARVQAYFVMHQELRFPPEEPNRPADKEGLLLAKKILSSILNDSAVKWNLIENILSFHLSHSRLVELTARIRNETYERGSLEKEDEFKARYNAAKDINLKEFPFDISKLKKVAPPILGHIDENNPFRPYKADTFFFVASTNYY